MKKLKSTLPNMAIVLTLISVIAGGLLAYVNKVTEGPIKEINEKTLAQGLAEVLNANTANVTKQDTLRDEKGALTAIVYTTDAGTAVLSNDANGFGGTLGVLVGFDESGVIKGYKVMETHETPGLGVKADFWFKENQGDKKSKIVGLNPGEQELSVTKDDGQIDAITASTITSRAFLRAVNAAYKAYKGSESDAASGATTQATEKKCCGKCEKEGEAHACAHHKNGEACAHGESDKCCKE